MDSFLPPEIQASLVCLKLKERGTKGSKGERSEGLNAAASCRDLTDKTLGFSSVQAKLWEGHQRQFLAVFIHLLPSLRKRAPSRINEYSVWIKEHQKLSNELGHLASLRKSS